MPNERIEGLIGRIQPIREQLVAHPLYGAIGTLEDVQTFMKSHVWAVWDFMSLLKALQRRLTCVEVPWVPVGSANTRYLINEIVVGEESDVDPDGQRLSHFELYLNAMQQAGADTSAIKALLERLQQGGTVETALNHESVPAGARAFSGFTFDLIRHGEMHQLAAVFTFGREDLIPDMFYSIVNGLKTTHPEALQLFTYYLERHIEVDGDHHSHLAKEMTAELCGNDDRKWQEAEEAVVRALESRLALWNDTLKSMRELTSSVA